ncbi:MAG: hypothetical protein LBJ14_10975 [Desulfarculales bacterium]|jgi:hypothetical protein|nr:hypothetical protein [Desulfarculales bacterium]
MKSLLFLSLLITGLLNFAAPATAGPALTPHLQENILRVAPDESSAFVPMVKPPGGTPEAEVLSRRGDWEEVRLQYRFKYNGSADPNICAVSLFEGTFTGFRKIPALSGQAPEAAQSALGPNPGR